MPHVYAHARLQRMLHAKERLPEQARSLFNDLYVDGKEDVQVARERQVPLEQMQLQKNEMLRQLMAASAS